MDMAGIIIERRKAKGLTQKQLAGKLGVSDKVVSKWERGNSYPDIRYLEPLAEALDIPVGELLKGKIEDANQKPEDMVKKAPNYETNVYRTRSKIIPRILMYSFLALGLAGIITTSIVDFALNKGFTWSLYPISSILFMWLCIIPLYLFPKRGVDVSLVLASIFIFPFLYVISWLTGGGWYALLAIPMIVAGIVILWLVRIVFATRLGIWNKLAVSLVIVSVANILIALKLGKILKDGGFDVWNLISATILVVIALFLFIIGRVRNK